MVGKYLDNDRPLRREVIFFRKLFDGLFQQRGGITGDGALVLGGALDNERPSAGVSIIAHRIEQVECVLGPDVERIAPECFLELSPAFGFIAGAEQLDSQFGPRTPEPWLEFYRAPFQINRVKIPAILYRKVGQNIEELCRPWVHGKGPRPERVSLCRLVVQ